MGNESDRREVIFAYEIDGGGWERSVHDTRHLLDRLRSRPIEDSDGSGEIDLAYGIPIGALRPHHHHIE
jgi:hypothetical protein